VAAVLDRAAATSVLGRPYEADQKISPVARKQSLLQPVVQVRSRFWVPHSVAGVSSGDKEEQ